MEAEGGRVARKNKGDELHNHRTQNLFERGGIVYTTPPALGFASREASTMTALCAGYSDF